MKTFLLLESLLLTQQTGRPEFGTVRGQIRSADGTPAAGVRVAAMAMEENGIVDPAAATLASLSQTDCEGRFRLQNVPPGRNLYDSVQASPLNPKSGTSDPARGSKRS
jgi:hypothetical protein